MNISEPLTDGANPNGANQTSANRSGANRAGEAMHEAGGKAQQDTGRFSRLLHPVQARYHGPGAPLGIRCANAITGFMGSWTFLWVQSALVAVWIALNVLAWIKHFDPYPFILLNLAFSTQAAYAAPLILMAGNVAAARDRELWENDYQTNQRAYAKIEALETQVHLLVEKNTVMLRQSQELLELLVVRNDLEAKAETSAEKSVSGRA